MDVNCFSRKMEQHLDEFCKICLKRCWLICITVGIDNFTIGVYHMNYKLNVYPCEK